MAHYRLYAMYDKRAACYSFIFTEENDSMAIRGLQRVVMNPDGIVGKYPEDFDMYRIGQVDAQSGRIEMPEKGPVLLCSAAGAKTEAVKRAQVPDSCSRADLGNTTEELHKAINQVLKQRGQELV